MIHTKKSYKELLSKQHPGYILISEFIAYNKLHTFRHKECGTEFDAVPAKIRQCVIPCLVCRASKPLNRTVKDYRKDILEEFKGEYSFISGEYLGLGKDHWYKHKSCGTEFVSKPYKLNYQKIPCPECRKLGGTCITPQLYTEYLEKRWSGEYSLVSEFNTINEKYVYLHNTCGNTFEASPARIRRLKIPCPQCRGIVIGSQYTTEEYKELLHRKWKGEYLLLGEYTKCTDELLYKHVTCGHEFMAEPYNLRKLEIPCSSCCPVGTGPAKRRRVFLEGKEFRVQGRENLALPYVWKKLGKCSVEEILHKKKDMPEIYYRFKGKVHRYYADFYIPSRNIVVEVKDFDSLGLGRESLLYGKDTFSRNCEKLRAVAAAGFVTKLVLVAQGVIMTLPEDWFTFRKSEMKDWIETNYTFDLP